MSNIVLNIKVNGELKENDIIIFKEGKWTVVSKESFLAKLTKKQNDDIKKLKDNEIFNIKEDLKKIKQDLVSLAKVIKEK